MGALLPPLTVPEKKARDKQRKRDQAKRRKAIELEVVRAAESRAKQADASKRWHRDVNRDEELQIRRYELDAINPHDEHPASAGYDFVPRRFTSLAQDVGNYSPIFFGYSLARGGRQDVFGAPTGYDDHLKHKPHPAFLGYAMSRHASEIISPIFLNLDFCKRRVGIEAIEDELSALQKQSNIDKRQERAELQALLDARFDTPSECLVCESSQIPGCPGCWVPSSDFFDRAYRRNNPLEHPSDEIAEDKTPHGWAHYYEAPSPRQEAKAREDEYMDGLLFDVWAIRKHREKVQTFISLVIKSIPAGSAVQLRIDPRETIQYLYDQYRANVDSVDRQLYLLLPTSQGLFYLDATIEAGSEVALGVNNGTLRLEDFQLRYIRTATGPYVLLSVALLHRETTPLMLAHYVKHNFTVDGPLNLQLRYFANQVPKDVQNDALQAAMTRKASLLVASATENQLMSRHYEQQALQLSVKKAFHERMDSAIELHRNNKARPRTKKEIRAWAYYSFAIAEPRSDARLQKLWQCYHKFDELKLTKRGKLLDSAASDDMCELLSLHRTATIQTFDLLVDKAHRPVLPPVVAVGPKFGVPIATRLGITAKEDREFGSELDIIIPEENDDETLAPVRRKQHLTLDAIRAAQQRPFKDMEWRASAKVDKFYSASDLLIYPFASIRWDCFAKAYVLAVGDVDRMRRLLDGYNNLAKILQDEIILKPSAIESWLHDLGALTSQLPPTGALPQACRRLETKSSLLAARAERHRRALEQAQDAARRRITDADDALPPMSAMERLKWEFKNKYGILSPNMRNMSPDMDKVRATLGSALAKTVAATTYVAQQAKDNMEILKL
ncbi:hypothetical protein SDRG_06528 [Saprolegnia diclina VS20]|uniref:Uncharacterized protein n=1 Tax=Saprolegnia diclina (strain VS20) TaxID=1156394 RepID=T0QCZ5_SAPDV|nr:hypothetical protein SDRG_06528 [Saprolegnia diclina VS20]EQC35769.1 hypothetical protein SDRG_06528 [Saprolegnia diclina VS20]|eukprot:XP_008610531.1 hypothetical protein SDRG_06528 [Saprolegnia diclina VS20]